jgi:hypothetical protein
MVMITLAQASANAAKVCVAKHTSPTQCNNYAKTSNSGGTGSWAVWGCTGGTVSRFSGISYCSDTSNGKSIGQKGDPGNYNGRSCWCMLTNPAVSAWVFRYNHNDEADCLNSCTNYCGHSSVTNDTLRLGLFSALGS